MRKLHSFKIEKFIIPGYNPIYDLWVKTTYNCKIPYRVYNGSSLKLLIKTANKYNLIIKDCTLIEIYDFTHDHIGKVSYTTIKQERII